MSCKCGCHGDKATATRWREYMPLIVGVALVGALIAGAVLKKDADAKAAGGRDAKHPSTAVTP